MRLVSMLVVFAGKGETIGHADGFVSSAADGIVVPVPDLDLPEDGEMAAPCKSARFETVVFARDGQTIEAGRVFFPEIESFLDVYTPRHGLVVELHDGCDAGSITWHVKAGGGQFEGATGIVTGNFTARPDGTFVDHQFFKLRLPD